MKFTITPADKADKARKAATRYAKPENRWRIEGEYVNCQEIGDRLGITETKASDRLRKLQKASGAITWARLSAA